MRVTGGLYRGRKIICPPGVIRPAMDRMRESMFAILGSQEGAGWLDLFSGSGSIGIEAASRGATTIHLVEKDRQKKETVMQNIAFVEEDITLFLHDVFRFLSNAKTTYDVIYADPPFSMEDKIRLLRSVNDHNLLREEGLFIIHYPVEEKSQWPERYGDLLFIDERAYGRSTLRFYKKEAKHE
jgi:16S rRNA (guanine(966)-N(2))-methyltransferase RsmD